MEGIYCDTTFIGEAFTKVLFNPVFILVFLLIIFNSGFHVTGGFLKHQVNEDKYQNSTLFLRESNMPL